MIYDLLQCQNDVIEMSNMYSMFVCHLQEKFAALVKSSAAFAAESDAMSELWQRIGDKIFSLTPREQELGLGEKVGLICCS